MSQSADRRREDRHHVYLAAEIVLDESTTRTAITKDVSAKGLLLLTRAKLAVGHRVRLRIYLPGEDDRVSAVTGEVVRREELAYDERGTWSNKVAVAFDESQPSLAKEFATLADEQARQFGWTK